MGERTISAMCAHRDCVVRSYCKRHPESGTKPVPPQAWFYPEHEPGPIGCKEYVE
jgi:hypothetical protein